jgi:hypothetical protein
MQMTLPFQDLKEHVHASRIILKNRKGSLDLEDQKPKAGTVQIRYTSGFLETFQLIDNTTEPLKSEPLDALCRTVQTLFKYCTNPRTTREDPIVDLRRAIWEKDWVRCRVIVQKANAAVRHAPRYTAQSGAYPLPPDLVLCLLEQAYHTAVRPLSSQLLVDSKPGTDKIYGEVKPPFITEVCAGISPGSKFLDLGSGVGNAVLQAALEFGCEAYGIEFCERRHIAALELQRQCKLRLKLWGLPPMSSNVELWQGDFLHSSAVDQLLPEVHVVLFNNFKYGPETRRKMFEKFFSMKDGAKVVSLIPLQPSPRKRGRGEKEKGVHGVGRYAVAGFEIECCKCETRWLSWTDGEGEFYVATRRRG